MVVAEEQCSGSQCDHMAKLFLNISLYNYLQVDVRLSSSKRDVKSYGFSYESCHQQTAPSSLCPSEGYESGGSDSGVHLNTVSPKSSKISSSRRHSSRQAQQVQGQRQRPHLMPIGEMGRKTFSSSGTSTSGSGGSAGHYESSGYESVMRDSECSSLDSSQESDRGAAEITALSPHHTVQAVLSGPCHKPPAAIGNSQHFFTLKHHFSYCKN